MENNKNIELRSEKVRNVIGDIPPFVVRAGSGVIALILVGLFLLIVLIPYPENFSTDIVVTIDGQQCVYAQVELPCRFVNKINSETNVKVEFEGFDKDVYGYYSARICKIDKKIIVINDSNYFSVTLALEGINYQIQQSMKGKAYFLFSDGSLLKRIMQQNAEKP